MAIEFNCPFCTSTIRVPDDAAGKKGTCPRCETPILVPTIEGLPQPELPAEQPPATPPAAPAPSVTEGPLPVESPPQPAMEPVVSPGEPVFPGPPPAPEGEFPAFGESAAAPRAPATSYARALKRRRKKKGGLGILVPLLFGSCLVGVTLFLWWQSRPTLYGDLTAEALPDYELATGGIGKSEVQDLSKDVINYVIEDLEENPARLTSELMETEFRGTRRGIQVNVFEGKQTMFFRVAPRKNKDFDDWVLKNADKLEKPRLKEYSAAIKRFFKEYSDSEGDVADLPGYRDSMGLNATVSRVGYNMAALVGQTAHRCVYEDAEQRLYFLLPKKTKQFELVGRRLDNGETLFPGTYKVKVQAN